MGAGADARLFAFWFQRADEIAQMLEDLEEDDEPYEFVLLAAADMNNPIVAMLKNEHNMPLVVFATDAQHDDPALDIGAPHPLLTPSSSSWPSTS
eukprot:703461-Prorocentrum_minimum.AAC.1